MGLNSKESACQCRNHLETRVQSLGLEDPWRRKWQPTPVFLPEILWIEEPGAYGPLGRKEPES